MFHPLPRRLLAVAFGPPNMAEALAGLGRVRTQADCVELRLDLFEEPFDLPALLEACGGLKVVATLRPPAQGGKSPLAAPERLKVLLEAARLGAHFVDIEYDACNPYALDALHAAGARVVVSRHDFAAMPAELAQRWWPELAGLGADVVKVVGTAQDLHDCLQVFRAFARADRPTIAIAMGQAGLLTRILALCAEQCLLTYAMLGAATSTAPGQLTLDEMRQTYRVERLRSSTRVFGLLGPHAEPERLAEYNAWFVQDRWDGVAVPFRTTAGAAGIVSAFRELPVAGWHVHGADLQTDVFAALDALAPSAARLQKVNGVARRGDGALVGHWVESPREQYEVWLHSGE
ncbi:MAG: type I 3-dehydroquinate dehydratase [Chloroflexi bacterium]|nr:type I 3-dehydroquinate dehydratase [Chloroflexota bacterium]